MPLYVVYPDAQATNAPVEADTYLVEANNLDAAVRQAISIGTLVGTYKVGKFTDSTPPRYNITRNVDVKINKL